MEKSEQLLLEIDLSSLVSQLKTIYTQTNFIASSTEGEFLAIGSSLGDFHSRANEISGKISGISELISEEGLQGALVNLQKAIKEINEDLEENQINTKKQLETLNYIVGLIETVLDILFDFKDETRTLKMFGTSIKIETVYLTNNENRSGFDYLADEVERLTILIGKQSHQILQELKVILGNVKNTYGLMQDIKDEHKSKMNIMFTDLNKNLVTIFTHQENISSVTMEVVEQSKQVSSNIANIVFSMQTHDITRQQMEHVSTAIADLSDRIEAETGALNEDSTNSIASVTGDICELQSHQLNSALSQIIAAVESIVCNLQGVTSNITEMTGKTAKMIGVDSQNNNSFLVEIEKGMNVVLDSLDKNGKVVVEMSKLINSLVESINGMKSFLDSIKEIGANIGRIAVNACIKAAQTGNEGAALGVLSESIQKLSVDARFETVAISGVLKGIAWVANDLQKITNIRLEEQTVKHSSMSSNISTLLEAIKALDTEINTKLTEVDNRGVELGKDIKQCIEQISVQYEVAEKVEVILKNLNSIYEEYKDLETGSETSEIVHYFNELKNRYTMESERVIHQDALGAVNVLDSMVVGEFTEGKGDVSSSETTDDGLGDNVELF